MIGLLAALLVVLPPLDWTAAAILLYVSYRNPEIRTLRERAVAAAFLAASASVGAVLAIDYVERIDLDEAVLVAGVGLALLLVSAPAVYWLWLLLSGRLDGPGGS